MVTVRMPVSVIKGYVYRLLIFIRNQATETGFLAITEWHFYQWIC